MSFCISLAGLLSDRLGIFIIKIQIRTNIKLKYNIKQQKRPEKSGSLSGKQLQKLLNYAILYKMKKPEKYAGNEEMLC